MAPASGTGMNDSSPPVPRRAGGHAAARLREQLEREFGIVPPADSPDPDAVTEPDADTTGPADAGQLDPAQDDPAQPDREEPDPDEPDADEQHPDEQHPDEQRGH
jgi:hypothetical protein